MRQGNWLPAFVSHSVTRRYILPIVVPGMRTICGFVKHF
jgi:hypothetical protein